jgi:hypothetical protein
LFTGFVDAGIGRKPPLASAGGGGKGYGRLLYGLKTRCGLHGIMVKALAGQSGRYMLLLF